MNRARQTARILDCADSSALFLLWRKDVKAALDPDELRFREHATKSVSRASRRNQNAVASTNVPYSSRHLLQPDFGAQAVFVGAQFRKKTAPETEPVQDVACNQ